MIGSSESSLRFIKLRRRTNKSSKTASPTESVSSASPAAQSPVGSTQGTTLFPLDSSTVFFVDASHPSRGAVYPPPSEGVLRAVEASERLTGSMSKSFTYATKYATSLLSPHLAPDSPKSVPDTLTTAILPAPIQPNVKDADDKLPSFGRRVPGALQLYKVPLCEAWTASGKCPPRPQLHVSARPQ
eukprot:PhM_4_TR2391/c2_g3_i3/m.61250